MYIEDMAMTAAQFSEEHYYWFDAETGEHYCWCGEDFENAADTRKHITGELTRWFAYLLMDKGVMGSIRRAADGVGEDSVWQHPADAAMVEFTSIMLGIQDPDDS